MLAKVLPLLLLCQVVFADDLPSEVPAPRRSHSRVGLLKKVSQANLQSDLKSLMTISWNKPSMVTYRERQPSDPKYKGDAIIRQLDSNSDKKKECVLPAISHEYTELETYLYSMENDKEILVITKRFDEEDPSTDIFVVDMKDCTYTTQVLAIDFSDIPERGKGYIVLRPWKSNEFDIFTFGDKNECGTWVCKRVFDIKNNLIKKPAKFSWLNDGIPKASPSWDLYDLIAIRDDRYIGVLTQSNTKARLDYLTERGADIKSMETFVNFFRDMKLQSSFSDIGMCYSMTHELQEMNCMQIDAKEGMLMKYNFTKDMSFNPQAFAMRTMPDYGGIMLFTLGCPQGKPRCQRYTLQLSQMSSDQTMNKLQTWNPDSKCEDKSEYDLTMYEDEGKMCMYYSCRIPPKKGQPDRALLPKCFEIPKPELGV